MPGKDGASEPYGSQYASDISVPKGWRNLAYPGNMPYEYFSDEAHLRAWLEVESDLDRYREWLLQGEEYPVLTHPADGSRWVLRLGDEQGRYVHLHPGRWSPATARVRANSLKTAFLVLCQTGLDGGDPMGRAVINEVRRELLGLPPVGDEPEGELGLGSVIELLREK